MGLEMNIPQSHISWRTFDTAEQKWHWAEATVWNKRALRWRAIEGALWLLFWSRRACAAGPVTKSTCWCHRAPGVAGIWWGGGGRSCCRGAFVRAMDAGVIFSNVNWFVGTTSATVFVCLDLVIHVRAGEKWHAVPWFFRRCWACWRRVMGQSSRG